MDKIELRHKVVLQPPFEVSPLIRGARWSLLLAGLIYGVYRNRKLGKEEIAIRDFQFKQKVIKDAHDAKIKKWMNEEEMKYLSEQLGAKIG